MYRHAWLLYSDVVHNTLFLHLLWELLPTSAQILAETTGDRIMQHPLVAVALVCVVLIAFRAIRQLPRVFRKTLRSELRKLGYTSARRARSRAAPKPQSRRRPKERGAPGKSR